MSSPVVVHLYNNLMLWKTICVTTNAHKCCFTRPDIWMIVFINLTCPRKMGASTVRANVLFFIDKVVNAFGARYLRLIMVHSLSQSLMVENCNWITFALVIPEESENRIKRSDAQKFCKFSTTSSDFCWKQRVDRAPCVFISRSDRRERLESLEQCFEKPLCCLIYPCDWIRQSVNLCICEISQCYVQQSTDRTHFREVSLMERRIGCSEPSRDLFSPHGCWVYATTISEQAA